MSAKDPKIDAYIADAADFAKPILKHLRKIVHAGCPDVQETIKWSRPHFDYKGVMCGMAAFNEHCAFGFWKESLILGRTNNSDQKRNGQLWLHPLPGRFARRKNTHRLCQKSR